MSAIFGLAQMSASDYQYVRNADQRAIYDATVFYTQTRMADMLASSRIFISGTTEAAKERYYLPGTGIMSRRADGVRGAAVRPTGSWDVGYTLEDFSEQVAGTDVDFAYMTPEAYQRSVDTIINRHVGRYRQMILYYLLNNSQKTYVDQRLGSITVEPLANGDAVLYPPVLGSDTDATDNHYIETNYLSANISDSNNPYITARDELEEHFGAPTGGSNIACFINNAQRSVTENLTDFTPVEDVFVRSGSNVDVPVNLPSAPGRILGRTNGVWVIEWRYIPANYIVGVHLEAEPPLKERVDPTETGLPRGLTPVVNDMTYPIQSLEMRARYGLGVANRLNGVVLELGTGGTYSIPSAYASIP